MGKLSNFYNLADTSDATVTAADISTGQTAWASGSPITGTSQRHWNYASIALAESSGDPWASSDEIQINNGALFLYYDSLVTNNHSGLIHKNPFGDSDVVSSGTVIKYGDTGSDPDDWEGYGDSSTGVKGTDYEYDVNGGKSRLRAITSSGKFTYSTYGMDSSDIIVFRIFDAIRLTYTGIQDIYQFILATHNVSGDFFADALSVKIHKNATNWVILSGSTTFADTGIPFGTPSRIWSYSRAGSQSIWGNDNATPVSSTYRALGWSTSGPRLFWQSIDVDETVDVELGYHLAGRMTTA